MQKTSVRNGGIFCWTPWCFLLQAVFGTRRTCFPVTAMGQQGSLGDGVHRSRCWFGLYGTRSVRLRNSDRKELIQKRVCRPQESFAAHRRIVRSRVTNRSLRQKAGRSENSAAATFSWAGAGAAPSRDGGGRRQRSSPRGSKYRWPAWWVGVGAGPTKFCVT